MENATISRKGVLRGLLGAAPRHACFCGFDMIGEQCVLPANILGHILTNTLPPTADMTFLKTDIASIQGGRFFLHQNERVQRTLRQIWQPDTWNCPEMDPSDHWGIMAATQPVAWLRSQEGNTIRANDLLEVGKAGPLRVGTVGSVLSQAKTRITPFDRIGTMNPSDGSPITGHTKCEVNRDELRGQSLAAHFVNDLFPAAQGVVDSPAVSHCMRYAIEVARLSVIAIITGTSDATRQTIMASMSPTANSWKRRCAAQIDLLGICVATKALSSPLNGRYSTGDPEHCPFRLSVPDGYKNSLAYITPGCLVYVHSSNPPTLHDPCQHHDCTSESVPLLLNTATQIRDVQATKVLFNPTEMVDPFEVRGTWARDEAPLGINRTDYDAFLDKVAAWHSDLTKDLPGRLTNTALFRKALINEEASGVGGPNVVPNSGAGQGTALKSATETNSRHCDMMQVSVMRVDLLATLGTACRGPSLPGH